MTRTVTAQLADLYLARHGESEWNESQRISGQDDPALSPVGVGQAVALAHVLADAPLTAIYTGTLQRTIATASPTAAAHKLPIQPLASLQEISLGVLEGRYRAGRDPAAQQLWQHWQQSKETLRIPGGETFPEFEERECWAAGSVSPRPTLVGCCWARSCTGCVNSIWRCQFAIN